MDTYSKEEISKLLESWKKDNNDYRNGSGAKYLSQSDVGSLLYDPKKFRSREGAPLVSFLHGSYYHESILEPHKLKDYVIIDATTRSTKIYKEALEEHGTDVLMLRHEKEHLDELVEGTLANKFVRSFIQAKGNIYEKPHVAKIGGDNGEWFKGIVDILSPEYNRTIDLKTTSSPLNKFKWKAKEFNYDAQAYIYQKMTGLDFMFIVCEKATGNLGVFECSDSFISGGQHKVEKAIEVYQTYYKDKTEEETRELLANRITHEELF